MPRSVDKEEDREECEKTCLDEQDAPGHSATQKETVKGVEERRPSMGGI